MGGGRGGVGRGGGTEDHVVIREGGREWAGDREKLRGWGSQRS